MTDSDDKKFFKARENKFQLIKNKLELLNTQLVPEWLTPADSFFQSAHRVRADLTLHNNLLGFWNSDKSAIQDFQTFEDTVPALTEFIKQFKLILPPVHKASLRFRVGIHGELGLWMDAANIDIKKLLDEKTWLNSLFLQFPRLHLEMGQKRKTVMLNSAGDFKLTDPTMYPWFKTFFEQQEIPLYSCVGDFTQPSVVYNRFIADWFRQNLEKISASKVVEFGTGNGNLSFLALLSGSDLIACETEERSLQGFIKSINEFDHERLAQDQKKHDMQKTDLRSKIKFLVGDHRQTKNSTTDFSDAGCAILNPARSGLGHFTEKLSPIPHLLYMSCDLDSWFRDSNQLMLIGYRLVEIKLLDQFPKTNHVEILSHWKMT